MEFLRIGGLFFAARFFCVLAILVAIRPWASRFATKRLKWISSMVVLVEGWWVILVKTSLTYVCARWNSASWRLSCAAVVSEETLRPMDRALCISMGEAA